VAPGKTPEATLDRWNQEIVKALKDPEVNKMLLDYGLTPQPTTRQELTDFIKKEYDQWGKVVKQGNLQGN
jgi:tripartite-type tricarboxylate transporter receptor subunit TctC